MSLAHILEKILLDAHTYAENIQKTAHQQAHQREVSNEALLEEEKKRLLLQEEEKREQILQKARSMAMTHRKTALSEARNQILSQILEKALFAFAALPREKKKELYRAALKKFPPESGILSPALGESKILQEIVQELSLPWTIAEERLSEKGGFLFSSAKVDIDGFISSLLQKEVQPFLEKELSLLLFPSKNHVS